MFSNFFNKAYAAPRYVKLALSLEWRHKNPRGALNFVHNALSLLTRPAKIQNHFMVAQIEPTVNCNLNCAHCEHDKNIIGATMKFEQFQQIIDQLPHLRQITLTGRGEGFLNKDIFSMIRYAKKRKIYVRMTSNGVLLTPFICNRIMEAGLDELRVSIDSAHPDHFRKIRGDADLDAIIHNIEYLNSLRWKKNKKSLTVEFNTVLFSENVHELEDIIRLAHRVKVDAVFAFGLLPKAGTLLALKENQLVTLNKNLIQTTFDRARRLANDLSMPLRLPNDSRAPKNDCYVPWLDFYVTYDGYILPCCMATQIPYLENKMAEYALGNIFKEPWHDIKNNQKFMGFRRALNGNKIPKMCHGCNILDGTF
ncbi:MAG: radical SAM protein [Deltaproteobacteria bacterium]|nr:radical SAM protein [Deltaproteobacteria bacterium]